LLACDLFIAQMFVCPLIFVLAKGKGNQRGRKGGKKKKENTAQNREEKEDKR